MTDVIANASKAVTNASKAVANTVQNAANSTFQMVANVTNSKAANSLLPLGNAANRGANNSAAGSPFTLTSSDFMLYGFVVVALVGIFVAFNKQIRDAFDYMARSIRNALGTPTSPPPPPEPPAAQTGQAVPPQSAAGQATPGIVEKVLPTIGEAKEVYNVSQNDYTFYDAEPLCKALGAELATYDQVKDAWNRGADWCNYGWVKGQMAVYPTQAETYDKLQSGSPDQMNACGTTGINGGFFDNPELRFGVNCYGKKPPQSAYDEQQLMKEGKIPQSPGELKYNELVDQFRKNASTTYVVPFNDEKWSSA